MGFFSAFLVVVAASSMAQASWQYSAPQTGLGPAASVASSNQSMGNIELTCNMIRYQTGAQDVYDELRAKRAVRIDFMENGSTVVGSMDFGEVNATIEVAEGYIAIIPNDMADLDFVFDQLRRNRVAVVSRSGEELAYGIFGLEGSSKAIDALQKSCRQNPQDAFGRPL